MRFTEIFSFLSLNYSLISRSLAVLHNKVAISGVNFLKHVSEATQTLSLYLYLWIYDKMQTFNK